MQVTMAMPYRCAQCDSPWPADKAACWACGSTERIDNPGAGMAAPVPRAYMPRAESARDYHPQVSQTPYVVVTIVTAIGVGVLVWWMLRGVVANAFGYGVIAGGLMGANVWVVSLIYITKARVDRNGRVLDDLTQRLHQP